MTINTIDSKERELISIIRNSKAPVKALQIALEVMLKMLEAKQEARDNG